MKFLAYISIMIVAIALSASAALAQEASPAPHLPPTQQKALQKKGQKQKAAAAPKIVPLPGAATLITAPRTAAQIAQQNEDYAVIVRGDEALSAGDTDTAIAAFLEARQSKAEGLLALVRLADAYTVAGRTEEAIAAYRQLIYPPPGKDRSHANQLSPTMQMNFVLLLLQTGQEAEALTAYRRALTTLNYDGLGNRKLKVLLPEIGPSGLPYTRKLLRAMACLGIGVDTSGYEVPWLKEAAILAPDSAAANFYLGQYLYGSREQGAKTALERAIQLGDAVTAEAAEIYLQFCH